MKIGLIVIGKTDAGYFVEAINEYKNRLTHYIPFEMEVIPDIKNVKNLSEAQQKEKEGELILKALQPGDYLVLLDEKGKEFTSMQFSTYLENENALIALALEKAKAANVDEGIEKIETYNPELIFLDIQMPGKTGFDLLAEVEKAPKKP